MFLHPILTVPKCSCIRYLPFNLLSYPFKRALVCDTYFSKYSCILNLPFLASKLFCIVAVTSKLLWSLRDDCPKPVITNSVSRDVTCAACVQYHMTSRYALFKNLTLQKSILCIARMPLNTPHDESWFFLFRTY